MNRILTLLSSWKACAAALAIGLIAGCLGGYHLRDLQADAADGRRATEAARQTTATLSAERQQADITQAVGESAARAQEVIRWRTQTLIREVPVYVTQEADDRCIVPAGFVRLHDLAAAGPHAPVPESARGADDAPSGVALSAVAETVTGNYGTCDAVARQLTDLQAWVRAQQALADDVTDAEPVPRR